MINRMPAINVSLSDPFVSEIARQIVKSDGTLFASKPKKASGFAKYVWRMVAFQISPIGQHHCMPMTADFDVNYTDIGYEKMLMWNEPGSDEQRRSMKAMLKVLDDVTDAIVNTVPKNQWHGISRWARAMGR